MSLTLRKALLGTVVIYLVTTLVGRGREILEQGPSLGGGEGVPSKGQSMYGFASETRGGMASGWQCGTSCQ